MFGIILVIQLIAADSLNVMLLANYNTPSQAYGVSVVNNYAYVADDDSGLRILDVSTPRNPVEVGHVILNHSAIEVFSDGNNAYVSEGCYGFERVSVTDPTNPHSTGIYLDGTGSYNTYVIGSYVYSASGVNGLYITRLDSTATGSFDTPGTAKSIVVNGNYAYVADYEDGLRVIDVGSNPHEVGYLDTDGHAEDVFVENNIAYLADGESGLKIIDVSDPLNPHLLSSLDTPGYANGVYVEGGFAYIADGCEGLRIINVSDASNPQEVGYYVTSDYASDVYVVNSLAYVAANSSGIQILGYIPLQVNESATLSSRIKVLSSEADVEFILPNQKVYNLEIFDLTGRLIVQRFVRGTYRFSPRVAGVYIWRLRGTNYSGKVMFAK